MPLPTPVASNITKTTADLSCAVPTGLQGPLTYQYERWQGSGAFTPGPVVVTPDDGSDGTFTPSVLTFAVAGTFQPPPQTVVYTPASNGSKSLAFVDNRDLTDPALITFVVAAYTVAGSSFVSPTVQQIIRWTGISTEILEDTNSELTQLLGELTVLAEAETAIEVTRAKFRATDLNQDQIIVLQKAVAFHTAGDFILEPAVRRLTGTHGNQLMESGMTMDDVSRAFHSRATGLSVLFATGGDVSQIGTRMAVNAARSMR